MTGVVRGASAAVRGANAAGRGENVAVRGENVAVREANVAARGASAAAIDERSVKTEAAVAGWQSEGTVASRESRPATPEPLQEAARNKWRLSAATGGPGDATKND